MCRQTMCQEKPWMQPRVANLRANPQHHKYPIELRYKYGRWQHHKRRCYDMNMSCQCCICKSDSFAHTHKEPGTDTRHMLLNPNQCLEPCTAVTAHVGKSLHCIYQSSLCSEHVACTEKAFPCPFLVGWHSLFFFLLDIPWSGPEHSTILSRSLGYSSHSMLHYYYFTQFHVEIGVRYKVHYETLCGVFHS